MGGQGGLFFHTQAHDEKCSGERPAQSKQPARGVPSGQDWISLRARILRDQSEE